MLRNEVKSPVPVALQDMLKALSNETRQRMVFLFLDAQARTVGEIAKALGISASTASEHLTILRRGGVMKSQRLGKEVYYCPDRQRLLAALGHLKDLLTACCPPERS